MGGTGQPAPSDTVNIALIGAGGQGRTNARALFKQADARIVAIADPASYFGLERFYYGGMGGREPVREEIERHYAATTPTLYLRAWLNSCSMDWSK